MKILSAVLLALLLLHGCGRKAQRTFYDKESAHKPIDCLKLNVTPPDASMQRTMKKLYHFTTACPYTLTLSYKSGIVCNSHYNAQTKALGKMPSSYLNLEVRRGFRLLYSYYIDLDHKPDSSDIQEGFEAVQEDLHGLR
jgi:hypothetical protein